MTDTVEIMKLDAGTTWFRSDEHFGHANIIDYCERPFDDVEHMTAELIKRHNAVVQPTDTVVYLGDFSLSASWLWPATAMHGRSVFLRGNHDKIWPAAKDNQMMARYQAVFDEVLPELHHTAWIDDTLFLLSHVPYVPDERHGERYAEQRPVDEGLPLICGHVHGLWKTQGRMFNVGVDVHDYAPVPATDILAWAATLD